MVAQVADLNVIHGTIQTAVAAWLVAAYQF